VTSKPMTQTLAPTHPDQSLPSEVQAVLRETIGEIAPELLLRSCTRVDTGRWLGKSPIWLCVTASDVLLLAVSKRRYLQRMPLADCNGTEYCHTSGALLLQPSNQWRFNAIALPPTDALHVLRHIERANQTLPSPVTEPTGA